MKISWKETWSPVVGAIGYEVSSKGRVRSWLTGGRSKKRRSAPKIRKLVPDKDGYLQVGLIVNGTFYMRKVHHLVLEAFVGPRPKGTLTRHKNRDVSDNEAGNLLWGTAAENVADSVRHGTHTLGERNGRAKLSQVEANLIRVRLSEGERGTDLAKEYDVSQATICRVKKGLRYVREV